MKKVEVFYLNDEVVERDYTAEELAQHKKDQKQYEDTEAAKLAEVEAKATAKATAEGKLAALGLTTDDLRALGL